jgi:GTPase
VTPVSALTGEGLDALAAAVADDLAEPVREETLHLGFDEGRARAWLFERHLVRAEAEVEDGYRLAVRWTDKERSQYNSLQAMPASVSDPAR